MDKFLPSIIRNRDLKMSVTFEAVILPWVSIVKKLGNFSKKRQLTT